MVVVFATDSVVALAVVSFKDELVVMTGSLVVELIYGDGSSVVVVVFA